MHLDSILLGLLRKPATGYEIKQSFDRVFAHIWAAELSQIYRTLKKLEQDGCLSSRKEQSKKGPAKVTYSITAKGRKRLRLWLHRTPQVGDIRHAHVAQLYFLGELQDFRVTQSFLERLLEKYRQRAAALHKMESEWRTSDPAYPDRLAPDATHSAMALRMGIAQVEALTQWAEASLKQVRTRIARKEK